MVTAPVAWSKNTLASIRIVQRRQLAEHHMIDAEVLAVEDDLVAVAEVLDRVLLAVTGREFETVGATVPIRSKGSSVKPASPSSGWSASSAGASACPLSTVGASADRPECRRGIDLDGMEKVRPINRLR
jgi:hypothetical protein